MFVVGEATTDFRLHERLLSTKDLFLTGQRHFSDEAESTMATYESNLHRSSVLRRKAKVEPEIILLRKKTLNCVVWVWQYVGANAAESSSSSRLCHVNECSDSTRSRPFIKLTNLPRVSQDGGVELAYKFRIQALEYVAGANRRSGNGHVFDIDFIGQRGAGDICSARQGNSNTNRHLPICRHVKVGEVRMIGHRPYRCPTTKTTS